MFKRKRVNRSSEIITPIYEGEYDISAYDRIIKEFFLYVSDEHDQEQKEKVINDLFAKEKGIPFSEEERRNAISRIKEEIRRRGGFNETRKSESIQLPILKVAMRIAAILVPFLVIGGIWYMTEQHNQPTSTQLFSENIEIPNGQTKSLELPDNSTVMINSGSTLNISQNEDQRLVELSGESFFKVAKDEKRSFVVKTDDLKVTVLGTQFNIEAYPDRELIIVTLSEGLVDLTTENGKTWQLTPNRQFIYNKITKEGQIIDKANLDSVYGWMTGQMICESKSVQEIFRAVERKFGVIIEIDPNVKFPQNIKYTMRFESTDNPRDVMTAIREMVENFDFMIDRNNTIIVKPQSQNNYQ